MEWISVKDRLPEEGDTVLGWERGYYTVVERHRNGWYWGRDEWIADEGGTITHWQPLPEPPEVG